jgi:hypothetical protein
MPFHDAERLCWPQVREIGDISGPLGAVEKPHMMRIDRLIKGLEVYNVRTGGFESF